MNDWLEFLSDVTGIRTDILVPVVVFGVVVVLVVVGLIIFALVLVVRSSRRERAGQEPERRTRR
jgi:hypothetical protein